MPTTPPPAPAAATPYDDHDDVRHAIERFIAVTYAEARRGAYAEPVSMDHVAATARIAPGLAEKIAAFLEREGLLDFDNQAVDLTLEGILRAEAIAREQRGEGDGDGRKRTAGTTKRRAARRTTTAPARAADSRSGTAAGASARAKRR